MFYLNLREMHRNPTCCWDLPAEGLEPTRSCDHWILSPARLPVPPRRREEIKLQKRSGSSSGYVRSYRKRNSTISAGDLSPNVNNSALPVAGGCAATSVRPSRREKPFLR